MKKTKRRKPYAGRDSVAHKRLAGLVRVVGRPVQFQVERHVDETRIDHVWLDVEAAEEGLLRIALNTWSRSSFASGFDPRIQVAMVPSPWSELPPSGVFHSNGLNYSTIETKRGVAFRPYDRTAIELLLIEKFERAVLVQVWGELYARGHRGLHQVHSRRASAVVQTDHIGRDGALCFYYENGGGEKLLFKFFGQP